MPMAGCELVQDPARSFRCIIGAQRHVYHSLEATGETAVQGEFLHLLRDFSHKADSLDMSGNPPDFSKGYFRKPIGSSNPPWSASKSLILQQEMT